jgi:hypothetical protein
MNYNMRKKTYKLTQDNCFNKKFNHTWDNCFNKKNQLDNKYLFILFYCTKIIQKHKK